MTLRLHIASIEPLAGARVAVIDSGIHATHPHVQGIAGGVAIGPDGIEHDDIVDRLGHGTAVAAVIREKAPGAELLAVKVFDRALGTSAAALAAGIRWAAAQRVALINLSLGTSRAEHVHALRESVKASAAAGALIVAAAEQAGTAWLPGSIDSPTVVAVTLDWECPRDECVLSIDERDRVSVRASGWPRPIPGVPPDRNLKGISFAVANATGFLARALGAGANPGERLRALVRP